MRILGIHDGHTATACVIDNGKLKAMVSEERIWHKKEMGGFPTEAIKEVLSLSGLKPEDIDKVAVATLTPPLLPEHFSDPGFPRNIYQSIYRFIPRSILQGDEYVDDVVGFINKMSRRREYIERNLKSLGINAEVVFVEHHLAHASSAFFGSGFDKALVITLDGAGDGISGTYYVGEGLNLYLKNRISAYNSLGEFYTRITEYLGLKPLSHEYKVMGLAPYADSKIAEGVYKKVRRFFEVKGDRIINRSGVYKRDYLRLFKKVFFKVRFDIIAYVAQKVLEDVVFEWVANIKGGYDTVALAGGVFMNVKLNFGFLERFSNVFVMPSAGDESLAFGAAAYVSAQNGIKPEPIGVLYLGREFSQTEIERAFENLDEKEYKIERIGKDIHEYVAELLSEGWIVARFFGKSEWGARALGNRSILADPRSLNVVSRINRAIKHRDFWMPFAPSVLDEDFEDYFIVPTRSKSEKYMILGYPSRPRAQKEIPAALHQGDLSGRPQVVFKNDNPEYYSLIKRFKEKTGVGAVLNTSFNLHGYPIVYTPEQAIFTLINSDLDALAIGEYLVRKIK
ncbi:MAG: carbamoyltransferase C-terminal domain-containing protein [candidate division WOR-3 bacterium]